MSQLVVQSIKEDDLNAVLKLLKKKDLIAHADTCCLCGKKFEQIGGFIPIHRKVSPICDSVKCILDASFAVMKHNGNGSPVIENGGF